MLQLALQPADILIVRGKGWLSDQIRKLTRAKGEGRGWASHVALATGDQYVVEALYPRVLARPMPYARGPRLQVWRARNLSEKDKRTIAHKACTYIGTPYGWSKIVLHALGLQRFAFMDGFPICSWIVAASYAEAGFTFGVSDRTATPDDIHDFVRESGKYKRVL